MRRNVRAARGEAGRAYVVVRDGVALRVRALRGVSGRGTCGGCRAHGPLAVGGAGRPFVDLAVGHGEGAAGGPVRQR